MTYDAPVRAANYLLRHSIDLAQLRECPPFADLSDELIGDILQGGAAFARDVLAPLNRSGDENPAKLHDGKVVVSPGFKDAYASYVEAGWQGIAAPESIGGMGLPQVISAAVNEMFYAANMAFGLAPMLTASAMNALLAHGDEKLRATYLPNMASGKWSGAMNLTEPQAGSDLGALRAKAVPNADGSYAISGQKIFITWGDHDCAENIIHLVLARTPDAPAGSRGISLFLVPKYFVDDDGGLGARNDFRPISLEHKLGIHGSPTCVMEFTGAKGWLIGPENKGLACMFTMMNEARLFVGVQGTGIGERAFQTALGFANERVQGKVIEESAPAPIIGHPDVRRMLLDMKAKLMGARAICLATAAASDIAHHHPDEEMRTAAKQREELLTPLAKTSGSDTGVWAASVGVQVHGGMGFVEETGAAQHYRDARIAPIYEGTNGIQAMDLVGRKLRRDGGNAMRALIADLRKTEADARTANGDLAGFSAELSHLTAGLDALDTATNFLLACDEKDALAAATPFQDMACAVVQGGLLLGSVLAGLKAQDPMAANMQALARRHALTSLAGAPALMAQITSGAAPVFALEPAAMADL